MKKNLIGKTEGKIPLRKPMHRLEDSNKMHYKETELEVSVWIRLPQDRDQWQAFMTMVMRL
jgi:hypothetical protein